MRMMAVKQRVKWFCVLKMFLQLEFGESTGRSMTGGREDGEKVGQASV